jgi:hypothetical protein
MASAIQALFVAFGGSPTVEVTITASDRIRLASTQPFGLDGGDNNYIFGLPVAGAIAAYDGSTWFEVFGTSDWVRGVLQDAKLTFTTAFGSGSLYTGFFQDIPTFINTSTNADSLTDLDVSGYGWLIDDDGYTWFTRRGGLPAMTWVNTNLRLFLGYTGDETAVVGNSGTNYYVKSTYPCRGIIVPTRPVFRQQLQAAQEAVGARTFGGGWVGAVMGTFNRFLVSWYLDGPADCVDLHQHWVRYILPRLHVGAPINFYQDWGDSRRTRFAQENYAYSSTETVELNGYRGRFEGYVADSSGATVIGWEKTLRRRAPVSLLIEEATNG